MERFTGFKTEFNFKPSKKKGVIYRKIGETPEGKSIWRPEKEKKHRPGYVPPPPPNFPPGSEPSAPFQGSLPGFEPKRQ